MKTKILPALVFVSILGLHNLIGQKTMLNNDHDPADCIQCLTGELFTPVFLVDPATYLNSDWLSGDIYLSNGEIVRNKLIKYNGLLDELFCQEPKSKNIIKLDKEAIQQFHFRNFSGDTSVYFRKIKVKLNVFSDTSEVFGEVVCEGGVSLFVLHKYNFKKSEIINTSSTPYEKIIYAEEPVYVFRLTNQKTFVTRSLSRRSLYSFSPDNKDKIKEFLQANKSWKFVNNFYLKKLTQFLSTIVNQ